ncbi:MAG: gliding motility-associated C-terminal domain-containing protein [Chitinophagia bacterium]|nr:gliding motility-associated C-terminal domain-containing protein [Chitinophagia bacterium]
MATYHCSFSRPISPIAMPDTTTTYMVVAQYGRCIPDTDFVKVIIHQLPIVNAGPDQRLLAGSTAHLAGTVANYVSFWWRDSTTLECDTCLKTDAYMKTTTTYTLSAISDFGCKNSDDVTIAMYCDNKQIFIPNTFTPNGDGENDVFYPRGIGVDKVKAFRIYNRWGQLVFERQNFEINSTSNAWDGTYGGAPPKPDVYVYLLEADCDTGEPLFLKGDVTIIK